VAAPRGCGKSELVKGMLAYLVLAQLVSFPLAVAATTPHARRLYKDFAKKIATNELLLADFPEVCHPVRELDGAPQRAGKQHVDGHKTEIVWTAEYLSLPHVPGSPYGGVKMAYFGLDAAFRGVNFDGDRPDFVLVDDPETRESAKSLMQIEDRERILDQDIAGLAGEDEQLAIVVLTTVQNRYCLSYQLTDRKTKPAWNGLRYGTIERWPEKMDLWDEYITKRKQDQEKGDEHGLSAVQLYLDNREAMDAGAEMLTDYFTPQFLDDGTQLTYSTLQVAWNQIADTNMTAFKTEYQNDPDAEEEVERLELSVGRVLLCTSGLEQGELPDDYKWTTLGIDIGKYKIHWTKIAWTADAVGTIVDYGVISTSGLDKYSSDKAIEVALIDTFALFAEDPAITEAAPLLALVDSGDFTESVYEVCQRLGRPFYPAKGWDNNRFKSVKPTAEQVPFLEAYAKKQWDDKQREMWLYHVNTEWWKDWLQRRFLVDPFVDSVRVPGSMALFEPQHGDVRLHSEFARNMVSEGQEFIPIPNKQSKRVWVVKDRRNNHWLDSTALASAAGGCIGVRLVQVDSKTEMVVTKSPVKKRQKLVNPYGQPFLATER